MSDFELATPAGTVPAFLEGAGSTGVLLATGAGTGQDHPGVAGLRTRLAAKGVTAMTFEYAYRAAGRKFPDRSPRLLEVHRAAAAHLRTLVGDNLILAGRSMGGRMATMLAAQGERCRGVAVYGYPLHPPGKTDQLRVAHLGDLTVPVLFVSGSRDALARPDLIDRYLAPLATATLVMIDGADHSFRRKGTPPDEMLDHLVDLTIRWIETLPAVGESAPSRA